MDHHPGGYDSEIAVSWRGVEEPRADGREWQPGAARPVTERDQRASGRRRHHSTNDDAAGDRLCRHVTKQAMHAGALKWRCKISGYRHESAPTPQRNVALRTCSSVGARYLQPAMPAAARTTSILIVEDSPDLVVLLQRVLVEQGYEVRSAQDGDAGLASAQENEPDLLILDVGLPRKNGFEVVQELRRKGINAPTLMLTARGEVSDRITGLEAGADDYLVKPFDPEELVARVRALLRRSAAHGRIPRLCVGDVVLDPLSREVHRGDRQLVLTQREFALLEHFMRHAGQPLTRAEIAEQVWRQAPVDTEETNIVDVYVAYLRKKLDGDRDPPMLKTVRGVGYVLQAGTSTK
jgi:two-component system, OmpR family, response regulator MprA